MVTIGFGTNGKWTSRLIRWATRGDISHAWLEYPSLLWGGRWVAHAGSNGLVKVQLTRVERAYPNHRVYACKRELESGLRGVAGYVGAEYDFLGAIWNGILLVMLRITGWGWLWRIVHRNTSKVTCSEFVTLFLQSAGLPGSMEIDAELTTPIGLETWVLRSGLFDRIE
jgi:hypothetical protein